jgi:hypothetical protein
LYISTAPTITNSSGVLKMWFGDKLCSKNANLGVEDDNFSYILLTANEDYKMEFYEMRECILFANFAAKFLTESPSASFPMIISSYKVLFLYFSFLNFESFHFYKKFTF